MKVFAVIPTYNRRDILARCLTRLSAQSCPVTILVGDSQSTDGTADMIREKFSEVVLCPGSSDLWWTGATNLALRAALARASSQDYILCINDDTEVGFDYVEKLLASADGSSRLIGSVSVAVGADDAILDGGCRLNWYTAAYRRLNNGQRLSHFPKGHRESVDILPGRGTLIPVKAFTELGLFAERKLPHYAADYEFAARCAKAGYELVVSYDAVVHSRTELTGLHMFSDGFSWRELRQIFLERRSSSNIKARFYFAWLSRKNPAQAILFFALMMGRIIGRHTLTLMER